MAFKVKRGEGVSDGVSRIAKGCIKNALAEDGDEFEAIHTSRKEIKKLRAVLRLVRKEIGKGAYKERRKQLREAAGHLAPPRDAYTQLGTFERLIRKAGKKKRDLLRPLHSELRQECRTSMARFSKENHWKKARRILKSEPKEFARLRFRHDGWTAIEPGLKKSYRCAQHARDEARAKPTAANFHEWRKRVKDLLYNVTLLRPVWPEEMCALQKEVDQLSEYLGDHHDLHVLRQTAAGRSGNAELKASVRHLLPLIDAKQKDLERKALKLGERILSDDASAFCERIKQFWKCWKRKKEIPARHRKRLLAPTGKAMARR